MRVARMDVLRRKEAQQRVAHDSEIGVCGRRRFIGVMALMEGSKGRVGESLADERGHVVLGGEDGRDADPVCKGDERRRVWRLQLRVPLHRQLSLVVFRFFQCLRGRECPWKCRW